MFSFQAIFEIDYALGMILQNPLQLPQILSQLNQRLGLAASASPNELELCESLHVMITLLYNLYL